MDKVTLAYMLIWVIIPAACCVFASNSLAREKGMSVSLWTLLGIVPVFNLFFLVYLVGATNRHVAEKLDKIEAKLEELTQAKIANN